jgi:hypothetical protein
MNQPAARRVAANRPGFPYPQSLDYLGVSAEANERGCRSRARPTNVV